MFKCNKHALTNTQEKMINIPGALITESRVNLWVYGLIIIKANTSTGYTHTTNFYRPVTVQLQCLYFLKLQKMLKDLVASL